MLRFRVEQSNSHDQWFIAIRNLGTENGPLDQIREALERLALKTKPSHGVKKFGKQLLWKFEKIELEEVLRKIERVKLIVNIALTSDLFSLSQAMKKELSTIDGGVSDINHGVTNLHDGQQRIREGISDISVGVNALKSEQQEEERRKTEEWLSPIDFRSRQQEILKGAQAGTRQWLFESEKFQNWVNAGRGTLWCPGIPGAGKTVTSSIIINHLQSRFRDDNVAVTCLFCNYRDRAAQTAESFMGNLLKQVIQKKRTVSPGLKCLYNERKDCRPTFAESTKLFRHEISQFSRIFVVIDALDETSEHEDIRRLVLSELQSQPINLLVTSRYEKSIERGLGEAKCLEIRATAADIQTYVEARIPSETLLARHIQADPTLEKTVVDKIVEKSQGMFLMARFHMDSLVTKTKRKDVRKALESLPPELDGIYDQTMERIEGQGKDYSELAKQVLLWVSNTFRPFSLVELQFAMAVRPGMTELDDEDLDEQDLLVSVCAGLVVLDAETDTVRFVHYTTQEYFDRKKDSLFGNSHGHIATSCITYLSFTTFADTGSWISIDDHLQRKEEFFHHPLTHYAASKWADHAREVTEAKVIDAVLGFLDQPNNVVRAVRLDLRLRGDSDRLAGNFSVMHIAAMYGLRYVMKRLLNEGSSADPRDCRGRTPLMLASMHGYLSIVQNLLERDDVDINAQTYPPYSLTSLILAADRVRPPVIRILLQHGADANIRSCGGTALNYAVRNWDITSTELLLEAETDPDSPDEDGNPAVFHAFRLTIQSSITLDGRLEKVEETSFAVLFLKLFHKHGSNIKAKDVSKKTLLHVAAHKCDIAAVEMLLGEGLDPNNIDDTGQSPLHKTFDPDSISHDPRNAQANVLNFGKILKKNYAQQIATVRSLCEKGSRLDTVDHSGNTPLHIAAAQDSTFDAFELLLDKGAKIDLVNNKGCTSLLLAVKSSQLAKARLLLKRGADLQDRDNEGATVVHWATSSLRRIMFIVGESGAEVNVKTNDGCTPLHWALNSITPPNLEVARYLLDCGVDPEAKDTNGRTAFENPSSAMREAELRQILTMTDREELPHSPLQLPSTISSPSNTSIAQPELSELV